MMGSSLVHSLAISTLASSLAIIVVGVLRKPLRCAVGTRAAYWLWLLVPASVLAVLLPAPVHSARALADSLPHSVSAAYAAVVVSVNAPVASNLYVPVLAIWLLGAFAMLAWVVRRQHAFVRSLGRMKPEPSGIYRSRSIAAPLLLGAWRARIVVPVDFEVRYNQEERNLVLAHERAHLVRCDTVINTFATLCVCVAWFNPLMYWALGRLRFDQELACDALVVAGSKSQRRLYADTLLKTQLADESAWAKPLGCHWQSTHPLKERVAMLKYPSPGLARRLVGMAFCVAVTISGGYTAWAARQELPLPGSSEKLIAVNMKWWVNGADMLQPGGSSATRDIRVISGKEFVRKVSFGEGHEYETQCIASLSDSDRRSPVWKTVESAGRRIEGLILFECKLVENGKVFATPALLTADSQVATIEMVNQNGNAHVKLEFNASTLPARIAQAR
jgi:beta-lactamase regulating signal transducer with metallopeptidase domain